MAVNKTLGRQIVRLLSIRVPPGYYQSTVFDENQNGVKSTTGQQEARSGFGALRPRCIHQSTRAPFVPGMEQRYKGLLWVVQESSCGRHNATSLRSFSIASSLSRPTESTPPMPPSASRPSSPSTPPRSHSCTCPIMLAQQSERLACRSAAPHQHAPIDLDRQQRPVVAGAATQAQGADGKRSARGTGVG